MLKSTKPIPKATATTKKSSSVLKNEKTKPNSISADKKTLEKKPSITLTKNAKLTKSVKKNVMTTVHNVTVASPPTSAGKGRSTSLTNVRVSEENVSKGHMRSRTRTIAPEDSLLHQQKMMKISQPEISGNSKLLDKTYNLSDEGSTLIKVQQKTSDDPVKIEKLPKKDPVAFEINFEEAKKPKRDLQSASVSVTVKPDDIDDEDGNYSSDFESYESDFEAEPESSEETSSEDEIEVPPKDRIDSGSFDMSAKKSATQSIVQYDSIDDTVYSHDSGISYDDAKARQLSPRVSNFYKRGEELMKKIQFDSMTFDIFEQKPIPYEVFMTIYGQRGMIQACTQSDSLTIAEETQTEKISKLNAWTQNPPKFTSSGLEIINSKIYNEEKLGVGEENFEDHELRRDDDDYDLSIDAINNFSQNEFKTVFSRYPNTLELNRFVQNVSVTISNIIEGKSNQKELQTSKISICKGFFNIPFKEIEILKDTIITKIYTNLSLNNFLISTHKKEFQNFMCLWSISCMSKPIKIFSAWSDIKCLEIHPQMKDIIIGGCNDGTICMWDIQEINEFKLDQDVTMPCGIISLNQIQNDFALDNVCALKSLPHREFSNNISMFQAKSASQICSLHENGTLSIWTMLNVDIEELETGKKDLNFTHSQSKIKLIKNLSIDLMKFTKMETTESPRKKSAFEKTRYYFENDLFSDKVLRELQEIDTEKLQRNKNFIRDDFLRAIGFEVNFNEIFVASDSNYLVALSRLCLGDKARKIITNESNYISPTAIKIHPCDKSILAIGQSDGSVKFLKTNDEDLYNVAKKRTHLKRSNAASSADDVLAKSCAFQNIVEKEKKLYDETQALNNLESDELKAFLVNQELSVQFADKFDDFKSKLKITFDKNILNSFEISTGAVKTIEFTKSGEFMFILANKKLKIFDCWKNVEIEQKDEIKVKDLKCILGGDGSDYLIILSIENEILVYKLK